MITIGIGEYAVSNNMNETIVTHALGSCVAIIFHCPLTRLTAMAHAVLPEHKLHIGRVRDPAYKPAYFIDEVLPKMFEDFSKHFNCKLKDVQITIVGGADAMTIDDVFQVGKRNVHKIKAILNAYQARFKDHETGGRFSRTVEVIVSTGEIRIRKQPMII